MIGKITNYLKENFREDLKKFNQEYKKELERKREVEFYKNNTMIKIYDVEHIEHVINKNKITFYDKNIIILEDNIEIKINEETYHFLNQLFNILKGTNYSEYRKELNN